MRVMRPATRPRDARHMPTTNFKTVHLERKSSRLLQQIEETARDLRHEILATISPQDLQTCLRVLGDIRRSAAR